ncbi:HpcH/HpaI aldolase/citrate lyase family protein [Camelimonas lactis]|uniref:Citrate lyase subunit beta/citryl-CoA lyase n=1 Tax=Camelimonas lactis TaxID=659006 RepID=A0A4R2GUU7_9HYPH|nr:CoA ester lyase [Camelimonas lactis]TCO14577.1 citrate lyase subunit beta/citryl-CoA lyase [Camelimonas lactis]
MTAIRPRRSVLYMPGSNARALEKAKTLPADALILDLEDAVAPDAKASARDQVCGAVKAGGYGPREVIIRANGLDTPWGRDDILAAAAARPDGILIPKVSNPETLQEVGKLLAGAPDNIRVWAMVETPAAMLDIARISAAARDRSTRLACFVMGTNDLAKETRARFVPGRAPMLPWLSLALTAARAEGLDILDGVYNNISDMDGFRAECEQGRDFGFDGKTLIHPTQVEPANEIFAPPAAEVAWARKIIAAFQLPENAGKGVLSVDGKMVEILHAEMGKRVVAVADAIAARQG